MMEKELITMQKFFKCGDIGNNCNYRVSANSEDEVLQKVSEHAKTAHNMGGISKELADKVRAAIYTWF
jgi:predicted small metal-binding protein